MVRVSRALRCLFLPALLTLAACGGSIEQAQSAVGDAVAHAQYETQTAIAPTLLDVQDVVQQALPEPAPPSVVHTKVASAAADLIIRWEVASEATYTKRYRRPLWPGGASGVTWGVGYDGGHQTKTAIGHDWSSHPRVAILSTTSGVVGLPAKQLASGLHDVTTPFGYARDVLINSTLPAFTSAARRALGEDFERLPPNAAASLISLGYNRGWSMAGDRNREKRVIRDDCVPAADVQCIATQLRAMKRLWPDVRGLRDRRDDEARVATS